jgi:hypothetical protein
MSNRSRTGSVLVSCILVLAFLACTRSGETATESAPRSATLSEVTGQVDAKQPSASDYVPAKTGLVINSGAQVQTGDDGRVRVDLSSGTFFRAGPSSHFTIESMEQQDGDPFTQLKLETGKIWIVLTTGSVEVETPSGVASVRGSYLSVEAQSESMVKITCLEGDCSLKNNAGDVDLIAGQTAIIVNADAQPAAGNMTGQDFEEWLEMNPEAEVIIPAVTSTQGAIPPTASPTAQSLSTPSSIGPQKADFPGNYNPLTGLPVEDPDLFKYPALLISVSHFPPVARPQAGLSFAPWVFEFYITEGATRFLAVFHGDFPEPEIPISGDCDVRAGLFRQTDDILGNQVWLDENKNGRQEPYEPGVGGVCVKLYDAAGKLLEQTTTDSNGYYGFNVERAGYIAEFVLPEWLQFTVQNAGDENADSDADPASGRAEVEVHSTLLHLDAGLIPLETLIPTPDASTQMPKAQVGPIRSGRLIHADITSFFQSSCLIYAFASEEVLEQIPKCSFVTHEDAGGGSMMSIERMLAIADDNRRHTRGGFDYSSNVFSEQPPEGGLPANQVNVYVAYLNQSAWTYDPLYGSWLRSVDNADKKTPGELHADTDRLTGRQLDFENFIVIYVEHDVISPTNLDIHLEQGDDGYAFLFRDGMKYDIRWSTRSGEYEQDTGQRRPIQFLNADGTPAALKPGHTWIFVATPYSALTDEGDGVWRLRYYPPEGAK